MMRVYTRTMDGGVSFAENYPSSEFFSSMCLSLCLVVGRFEV